MNTENLKNEIGYSHEVSQRLANNIDHWIVTGVFSFIGITAGFIQVSDNQVFDLCILFISWFFMIIPAIFILYMNYSISFYELMKRSGGSEILNQTESIKDVLGNNNVKETQVISGLSKENTNIQQAKEKYKKIEKRQKYQYFSLWLIPLSIIFLAIFIHTNITQNNLNLSERRAKDDLKINLEIELLKKDINK